MDLHTKYRPEGLSGVVGQSAITVSLRTLLDKTDPPHAFLFTGPSGVGKTTLARICAKELGVEASGLLEIDAASTSGIDAMRRLTEPLKYKNLGGGLKALVIDECHALSKQAWQALLKPVEEPPSHVFFMFCTTEVDKVPPTIKTRCHCYNLLPLDPDDLFTLVARIAHDEEINIPEKAISMIVDAANGSARQALVLLSMVSGQTTTKGVVRILSSQAAMVPERQVIELCRSLIFKPDFSQALATIKSIKEETSPEGVRLAVVNYAAAVLLSDRKQTQRVCDQCLAVIDAFQGEFNTSEKWAPVLLACAESTMRE